MPWPLACITGIVTFALIGYFLPLQNQPLILQLVGLLAAGFVAGFVANRRGLLAATLGGAVATSGVIALLVAIGRASLGHYYELSYYAKTFGPFLVMGLVLPAVGGMAGQALRKWLRGRRSAHLPGS